MHAAYIKPDPFGAIGGVAYFYAFASGETSTFAAPVGGEAR